jgi:hypothetical protein
MATRIKNLGAFTSIPFLEIDPVLQGLPLNEQPVIFDKNFGEIPGKTWRGSVTGDEQVFGLPEGMCRRERFLLEDIQHGPGQLPRFKGRDQRGLVHRAAAPNVEKEG